MASGASLGLDDGHRKAVVDYLRFARYKRQQRVRAVEAAFEDLLESRLVEDNTFSDKEVAEMVTGLQVVLKGDIESELIDAAHTQVLLLRQIFSQAQEWKLQLQPNISELENRQLLEEIAQFEHDEFQGRPAATKADLIGPKVNRLDPLAEGGPAAILHAEIRQLKQENARLKHTIDELEGKASKVAGEKTDLADRLTHAQETLQKVEANAKSADSEVEALQKEVASAKEELSKMKTTEGMVEATSVKDIEEKHTKTLHELLAVRSELNTTKEELEKKFKSTTVYINMQKMLATKNDQIKRLREKLSKCEGNDDD